VYVLAAAGGLWTHYSFPLVLAALNVAWLVWWLWARKEADRWRSLLVWLGLHGLVLLLYAPWLVTALDRMLHYGPISEGKPVAFVVAQALKLLSVGETVPDDDLTRWLTIASVGLVVFGLWGAIASRSSGRRRDAVVVALMLVLMVLAPIAMMVTLSLAGRPAYRPKFFLVASPAFCILVGLGIAQLEGSPDGRRSMSNRLWLLVGLGLVTFASARSLRNYYYDPDYARADYREIARTIRRGEREGDAILLNAPNQWEVFTYYYRGPAPVYPLCRSRPPQREAVVAELREIATEHSRLFAVYWATQESDPEGMVESWLGANAFKASDEWYGDVRLVTYAVPEDLDAVQIEHHLVDDVRLGDAIALRGYSLQPEPVAAGDILQVALFWEALSVPPGRYKVFLHLVDAQGRIVSQYDGEPGHGRDLTTSWHPERRVFPDRYGVPVPESTVPGEYQLLAGMYDIAGAPRLPVHVSGQHVGDSLSLGSVQVQ
jgi:hypothetical protein